MLTFIKQRLQSSYNKMFIKKSAKEPRTLHPESM